MKNCLIPLVFFTGFIPLILSVSRKYYLIQQGKSWTDAQTYCKAKHIELAIIEDNKDMIRLQNEIQTQQFISRAWIGLSVDLNSWRWSMGNESLGSYSMWATDQPNNKDGHQECVLIRYLSWWDMPCNTLYNVICFDDRNTGNLQYIYINRLMTWFEAQAYCRQHHTDLASAKDPAENTLLNGLTNNNNAWIGLFRDSWKWTDQTNFSTFIGQPDNFLGNGGCGFLNNGQVGDAPCSDVLPFFCYRNVTGQQQIVKVKVQSSEDVNNPAVMSAILDQINQKLKETGMMGNFTLKWRKQSDGEVFHKYRVEKIPTAANKHCDP